MTGKQVNAEEALEDIQKHITRCHESKHYMVAMWCIEDDEVNFVGRVTQGFPSGDLITAVAQFAVECSNEFKDLTLKKDDPPPPLPLADLVKKMQQEEADVPE